MIIDSMIITQTHESKVLRCSCMRGMCMHDESQLLCITINVNCSWIAITLMHCLNRYITECIVLYWYSLNNRFLQAILPLVYWYTWTNQFCILLNWAKSRLYSQLFDWFDTKLGSFSCQINRKIVFTIRIWINLTRIWINLSVW